MRNSLTTWLRSAGRITNVRAGYNVNRCHLSLVVALVAISVPRLAFAEYTLSPWPEEETPPPAPHPEQSSPPPPTTPPHFGGAGTVSVLGSAGLSTSHVDSFQSVAMVDLTYFFRENMALGVELTGATFHYRGDDISAYGIGPRGGYAIPIGQKLTILPTVALIYSAMNLPSLAPAPPGTVAASQNEHHGFTLSVDVSLLLHVTRELFAGVGASFRQDLTNYTLDPVYETDRPMVGGFLTFGGWLRLGETVPPTASSANHLPI
jgi:hypothetical protein